MGHALHFDRLTESCLDGQRDLAVLRYSEGTDKAADTGLGLAVVIPLIDEDPRSKVSRRYLHYRGNVRTSYVRACAGESDRPCHNIKDFLCPRLG
jgi:hypothetical protein